MFLFVTVSFGATHSIDLLHLVTISECNGALLDTFSPFSTRLTALQDSRIAL